MGINFSKLPSESIDNCMNNNIFWSEQYGRINIPECIEEINSKNGNIITFIHHKYDQSDKCIIISHGNGEKIEQYETYIETIANKFKVNVIVYDYQGYAYSEGNASEQNCYEDLESIVEHAKTFYDEKNIFLLGRSLGTGVVIHYVSTHDWHTPIILISPYKHIIGVVCDNTITNTLTKPLNKFVSEDKIKNVKCPAKIIHGCNDKVINISHGKRIAELFEKNNNGKFKPLYLDGHGHNNIFITNLEKEINEILNYI
jgi:abhydrolase domain-containing protein 17